MSRNRTQQASHGLSFDSVPLYRPQTLSVMRRRLLAWFDQNQRLLPWREDRDPYRIWVSEVMLQQTQVATVIPYYHRFLLKFPTLHDLAEADEQDVLRLWEGLGYYRRARDLHRAARLLVERHEGSLPNEPEVWKQLPGVGRYILGAVLSQAFDRRLPIVEANSKRVLCRLFGQMGDPASRPVVDWLWSAAEALLPRRRIGDFNQALMELGALVCTPIAPRCQECPLAAACMARKENRQDAIPAKAVAPTIEAVREVAVVVRKQEKVLLLRRPAAGRWAKMWEFPHLPLEEDETELNAAHRILSNLLGIKAVVGAEVLTIRHSVTRFRITLVALEAEYQSGDLRPSYYEEACWLSPAECAEYPVSRPQRILANEVARPTRQRSLF